MLNETKIFLDLQEPIWLITLIAPAILAWLYIAKRRTREQITCFAPSIEKATITGPRSRELGRHTVALTMVLVLVGLPFLASRPIVDSQTETDDVMLTWVIDTSQSMSQADVTNQAGQQVSRIEGVIEALKQTVDYAPEGAFRQLVTFSSRDDVVTHGLTRSSSDLVAQIDSLASIELNKSTVTEAGLAEATRNCVRTFELIDQYGELESSPTADTESPCLIFLLSDGQCDNQPSCRLETEAIAAEGHRQGMTIHTISWGDPNGDRRTSFLPDPEAMADIAAAGGGRHLASNQADELVDLYNEAVDSIETKTVERTLNPFAVWVARGLILLIPFWFIRMALAPILVVTSRSKR